jgi:hypothetical protein
MGEKEETTVDSSEMFQRRDLRDRRERLQKGVVERQSD